jgi:ABC-type transport system involved in Fe-S cluster assembly fused permease/ATPase subunit
VTSAPDTDDVEARPRGIRASAKRVVAHARALARLERELARSELRRKGATVGAGVGLAIAAALFALYAIGFGLAAATAALALVVDWWLALLIVFGVLLLLVLVLALASRSLFRAGTPLKPEQAIEEARLSKQVLRGARAE